MVKRSSKQIATDVTTDKYQTPTYFKQPPYWARKSRILWISMTAVAVAWLGFSFVGGGWIGSRVPFVGESIFSNGPLIDAHAFLSQDCGKCHTAPFSHVRDSDCLVCHSKTILAESGAAAHHPWEKREMAACSTCHIEHQGDLRLRSIEDRHCVACHGDFPHTSRAYAVGFTADPDDHPEINAVQILTQGAADPGRLKFNHKLHLSTEEGGVLIGSKEDIRSRKVLRCEDCHVPDRHGEYMLPIRYDAHCAGCHAHVIHPLDVGTLVPHASPSNVREFLLHHFYIHPPEPSGSASRPRRYVDDEVEFEKNVRAAVDRVEEILYRIGGKERCVQCHELIPGATSSVSGLQPLPEVAPTDVPVRWMEHSRFSHKAHLQIDCEECHSGVRESGTAEHILLPPIEKCADCHSPKKEVSSNCALCHTFHPEVSIPSPASSEPLLTTSEVSLSNPVSEEASRSLEEAPLATN